MVRSPLALLVDEGPVCGVGCGVASDDSEFSTAGAVVSEVLEAESVVPDPASVSGMCMVPTGV